jgi:hypothetical protein
MEEHPFWLLSIIAVICSFSLVLGLYVTMKIGEMHVLLNSRLSELLRLNTADAVNRGRDQQRDIEELRRNQAQTKDDAEKQ